MNKNVWNLSILFILIIFLSLPLNGAVFANQRTAIDYNPRAEHWVLIKLYQGQEADLSIRFPNPEDRKIRGDFLVKILDNPSKIISLYGVHISNATIVGDLSFKDRNVDFPVYIKWSTFEGKVELCNSHFLKYLSLQGGNFKSRADFCGLKVDDDVCLAGAIFNDAMTLSYADIKGSLVFTAARFNNKEQEVSFGNIKVGNGISLENATFEGGANFGYADVDGLGLSEARFNNNDMVAKFYVVNVKHTISLNKAVFSGGVSFQSAQAGSLDLNDVVFQNTEQQVTFENFSAESIFLNRTIFNGPVGFNNSHFEHYFYGESTQFLSTDTASFVNMDVGYSLSLNGAVFNGITDFRYTNIGHNFDLDRAYFNNSKDIYFSYLTVKRNLNANEANFSGYAYFDQINVGVSALFNNAVFVGPADFRFGVIGRNFEAQGTLFNSSGVREDAYFENMKVADHIIIDKAKFSGIADFYFVETGGMFKAEDVEFNGPAYFIDMTVGKSFLIDRSTFSDEVNFSRISSINFSALDTLFPKDENKVEVYSLGYDELHLKDSETGDGLFSLLDKSTFNGNDYRRLEKYYDNLGYPITADQIYLQYKLREATINFYPLHWAWWWNWFLAFFIGFGKSPDTALFWFFMIVMFGWFMFRKKDKMVPSIETDKKYRPLFYSLDLFLPFVDFGYAKIWSPAPEYRITKVYSIIHKYLGIILIPLAIIIFLSSQYLR